LTSLTIDDDARYVGYAQGRYYSRTTELLSTYAVASYVKLRASYSLQCHKLASSEPT